MRTVGKYVLCLLSGVLLGTLLTVAQVADDKLAWVADGKMIYNGAEYSVSYMREVTEEDYE